MRKLTIRKRRPDDASPFVVRESARFAYGFKLVVTHHRTGANEVVRAIIYRNEKEINGPDGFLQNTARVG